MRLLQCSLLLALIGSLASCTRALDGAPCPCKVGWQCCVTRCIRAEATCAAMEDAPGVGGAGATAGATQAGGGGTAGTAGTSESGAAGADSQAPSRPIEECREDAGSCAPAVCDGGDCVPAKVCAPGAETCLGTQVVRCDAFGSAWLPPEDCAEGETCSGTGCRKGCEPSSWYCQGGNAYQCSVEGDFAFLYQSCRQNRERCVVLDDSSYAFCTDGCKPGATVCLVNYNEFAICNLDGSIPKSGSFCPDGERCEFGACVPIGCPVAHYCQDSELYLCEGKQRLGCPAEEVCRDLIPGSYNFAYGCVPLSCSPGATACLRNQVGTCAPDGKSLSQVNQDCQADGSVCTIEPQCARTVTDTLGTAQYDEAENDGIFVANVIAVHSSRKLTEMQAWLALLGPRQLHWFVYELVGGSFVVKADRVVPGVPGSGSFVSSGVQSFSYQLEAGRTYVFGLAASGGSCITAYDTSPWFAKFSFGVLMARMRGSYSPSIDVGVLDANNSSYLLTDSVSVMKLVTESP